MLMSALRERAETGAIDVFARNLKDLLLAAPAGPRATMGLDPGLRTGVKVAVAGETPFVDIKYDPSLPPIPSRARSALDRVERERAYARFRLDLLDEA